MHQPPSSRPASRPASRLDSRLDSRPASWTALRRASLAVTCLVVVTAGPPASAATPPGGGVDIGAAGASVLSPIGPLTAVAGSSRATPSSVSATSLGDPTGSGSDSALACGLAPLDWPGARRLLLSRGPALALSYDRILAARADLVTAGERPNPTLSFGTAHYSPRQGVGPGNLGDKYLDSVLRIDQIIERGNKRGLRQAQAGRNVEAAEFQAIDDRRTQELALFSAYADLKLAEVTLANARDQADALRESLDLAVKRNRAGKLADDELVRHRIETVRATAETLKDTAAVVATRLAITALLGCPRSAVAVSGHGLDLPRDTPDLTDAGNTETAASASVEARPDVRAADARSRAAAASVELSRASLTRDIDFGLQYENDPGPGSGRTIGLGIAVPLFVAHRFEGEVARAKADQLAAEDTARAARVQASGEIEAARAQLSATLARARLARTELLPDTERATRDAEAAYRKGTKKLADMLDARTTLRAVRLEVSVADDAALRARAAWDAARGLAPLGLEPLPTPKDIATAVSDAPQTPAPAP